MDNLLYIGELPTRYAFALHPTSSKRARSGERGARSSLLLDELDVAVDVFRNGLLRVAQQQVDAERAENLSTHAGTHRHMHNQCPERDGCGVACTAS